MNQYYIALNPEKKLTDFINQQKDLVRNLAGEQTYLSHPPHFTLFIFSLPNPEVLFKGLEEIASQTNRFKIALKEIHVFYNDLFTNRNTITYPVSNKDLESLKKLQSQFIDKIDPFNAKKAYSNEDEDYKKMSFLEKSNINQYGYPFVGENWIPHITIASIEKDKFDRVFEKIKQKPDFGEFSIDSINLYEVGDKTSKLIRSFELK